MDNVNVRFSSTHPVRVSTGWTGKIHSIFLPVSSLKKKKKKKKRCKCKREEDQVEPTRFLQTDTQELAIGSFIPQLRGWDCGHCLKAFYYLQMHWPY
ncbi:hypothetical protein MRB53_025164 [Persea americana]|uniref:Uncharacterized protein n=1 Tax=Persea americana TaxID=3435 RepID=A0ACC2LEI2_PERAE|nr:hypothetical protein MRB53_025164 [Persea americana]